jgi:hypothetical protein
VLFTQFSGGLFGYETPHKPLKIVGFRCRKHAKFLFGILSLKNSERLKIGGKSQKIVPYHDENRFPGAIIPDKTSRTNFLGDFHGTKIRDNI